MAETVFLTKEGKRELQKRLDYLKVEKRVEITEKIKTAREFGDLSENAEYDVAKTEQAMVEQEILELEERLKHVEIINDASLKKDVVSIGSKVEVLDKDTGDVMNFEIVGTIEADFSAGRISNESPVGNALLGKKEGDTVKVAIPMGFTNLFIKKIH